MKATTVGVLALAACALAGCGSSSARLLSEAPVYSFHNKAADDLRALPAPDKKVYVGVFAFQDQTGQHKQNDNYADYSFAVTQGGASILMNALKEAGNGQWFSVLERSRIGDLLQERQIIRTNRQDALGPDGRPLPPLGPLLNAGIVVEGGIVGYDTNVLTGGLGASLLGIGATTQYRKDTVAVYLRAVSVLSGEVLVSITTDKTIYSTGLQGMVNRYVGFNKLLQVETGFTTNEPAQLAVRQAIEKAVYGLVIDGASKNLWAFADKEEQRKLVGQYVVSRDGEASPQPPTRALQGRQAG